MREENGFARHSTCKVIVGNMLDVDVQVVVGRLVVQVQTQLVLGDGVLAGHCIHGTLNAFQ
jgi:hypothetical protein